MGFFDRLFGKREQAGEFEILLERSMEELRLKTAIHDRLCNLSEASWAVDQDVGTIVFTAPNGTVATAPVQIVGTYNTEDGSWLWGWDHPSVHQPLQKHARAVQSYGEKHGIGELTTRKLNCSTDRAWQFCALACHLGNAQGAYRGPAGNALVYMTFGDMSLKNDGNQGSASTKAFPPIDGLKQIDDPDVLEFIHEYFLLNFEIEKAYNETPKLPTTSAVARPAIAKKREVYQRYWRRDEDNCVPRSIGWPSDYDLSRTANWRVFSLGTDTYRVAYFLDRLEWAYDVKRFEDGLRIVDRVF